MKRLSCIVALFSASLLGQVQPLAIFSINSIAPSSAGIVAGFGWEMDSVLNVLPKLTDASLIKLASALGPATIRIGGISADFVQYTGMTADSPSPTRRSAESFDTRLSSWPDSDRNLTIQDFEQVLSFFSATGTRLLFDLNELYGRNCHQGSNNVTCLGPDWDTSNVQAFLQYVHDNHLAGGSSPLFGFELGNELASHLAPTNNTKDILTLSSIVQQIWSDVPADARPQVFAPSTDDCWDGATYEIMRNVTGHVTGFTYHAYPQGGAIEALCLSSTWLKTAIMDGSASAACIAGWSSGPRQDGLLLWLDETSASWNWTFPGPKQNSFVHGFYYLSSLGQYGPTGVGFHGRWAYVDTGVGSFTTIGFNSSASPPQWDVAHDYWLTLLYSQSVGVQGTLYGALSITQSGGADSDALVYATCTPPQYYGSPNGQLHGNGTVTIMAVNPSNASITVMIVGFAGANIPHVPRNEYVFTAPNDDVSSISPVLNGNVAAPLRANADGSLPPLNPVYNANPSEMETITLPPFSQSFFVLLGANAGACKL